MGFKSHKMLLCFEKNPNYLNPKRLIREVGKYLISNSSIENKNIQVNIFFLLLL